MHLTVEEHQRIYAFIMASGQKYLTYAQISEGARVPSQFVSNAIHTMLNDKKKRYPLIKRVTLKKPLVVQDKYNAQRRVVKDVRVKNLNYKEDVDAA